MSVLMPKLQRAKDYIRDTSLFSLICVHLYLRILVEILINCFLSPILYFYVLEFQLFYQVLVLFSCIVALIQFKIAIVNCLDMILLVCLSIRRVAVLVYLWYSYAHVM